MFRYLVGSCLVLVCLLFRFPIAGMAKTPGAVAIGANSVEATNIRNAAEFIRSMGNPAVANNILQMLQAGKIYGDATMGENGDTSDGDITLHASLLRHSTPTLANSPFDVEKHLADVIALARTLFHEKVHVHQGALFKAGSNLTIGSTPHENEAWEATISAMNIWFQRLYNEYRNYPVDPLEASDAQLKHRRDSERLRLLKRALVVLKSKESYVGDYKDAGFYGSPSSNNYLQLSQQLAVLRQRLQKILEAMEVRLEPPTSEALDEVGQLFEEEKALGQKLASTMPRIPRDDLVLCLVGQGRPAGHIFDLQVTNPSQQSICATLPVGLALVPSHPDYQTMMIGEPLLVEVAAGQQVSFAVRGYCLDHSKLPPPQGLKMSLPQSDVEPGTTSLRRDSAGRIVETTTTCTTPVPATRLSTVDPGSGKLLAINDEVRVPGKLLQVTRDPKTREITQIHIAEESPSTIPSGQPPPAPTKPPADLHFTPLASSGPAVELICGIARAGNRLSQEGRLAKNIQSPDRYRATVIQRAIWSFVNGLDQKALLIDTRQQMEHLPAEKRPSDAEVVTTVERIWDDVDLTLKSSGVSR